MATVTDRVMAYIDKKGVKKSHIAKATGLSLNVFYQRGRMRQLKADEFLCICRFLEADPWEFWDKG